MGGSLGTAGDGVFLRHSPRPCVQMCDFHRHGAYLAEGCFVYHALSSVCLVLHWDDYRGLWQLTDQGCAELHRMDQAAYDLVPVGRYVGPKRLNIASLTVTIRSDEVPPWAPQAHTLFIPIRPLYCPACVFQKSSEHK